MGGAEEAGDAGDAEEDTKAEGISAWQERTGFLKHGLVTEPRISKIEPRGRFRLPGTFWRRRMDQLLPVYLTLSGQRRR